MKSTLALVLSILAYVSAGPVTGPPEYSFEWEPIDNNVCFYAKGDMAGLIYMHKTGFLVALKLVYRSGAMKCAAANTGSNWGCDDHNKINVFVTDEKKTVIFPPPEQIKPASGNWYTYPGSMSTSDQLVFSDFCNPTYVSNGDHLRIWFGEDLVNSSESDNVGNVCVKVYAVFSETTSPN